MRCVTLNFIIKILFILAGETNSHFWGLYLQKNISTSPILTFALQYPFPSSFTIRLFAIYIYIIHARICVCFTLMELSTCT